MPTDVENLAAVEAGCRQLLDPYKTLLLATASAEGEPDLSYAPFHRDEEGNFCIFVSELAVHTRNLLEHGRCSLLFIRDEVDSRNLFARERLSFQCVAQEVERTDPTYGTVLRAMEARFGEVVSLLRTLGDFRLMRLRPLRGRYVVGFGRAYDLDVVSGRLTPVRPERGD